MGIFFQLEIVAFSINYRLLLITFNMPKYYCDYCDTYLTHDSPSVRKTHCSGRKHKENVKFYYQKWMEDQAQSLIDATIEAYKKGIMKGGSQQFHHPETFLACPLGQVDRWDRWVR